MIDQSQQNIFHACHAAAKAMESSLSLKPRVAAKVFRLTLRAHGVVSEHKLGAYVTMLKTDSQSALATFTAE